MESGLNFIHPKADRVEGEDGGAKEGEEDRLSWGEILTLLLGK